VSTGIAPGAPGKAQKVICAGAFGVNPRPLTVIVEPEGISPTGSPLTVRVIIALTLRVAFAEFGVAASSVATTPSV